MLWEFFSSIPTISLSKYFLKMKPILSSFVYNRVENTICGGKTKQMKKILSALLMAALIFSPIGNVVFQDHNTTVEAKSYKSGKRSFNNNTNTTTNNNSLFQNKKSDSTSSTKSTATKNKGFFSGGLMKGLMIGGLAGLLFGSLFANMGMLGSILGLMINVFAIIILINIIRMVFTALKKKKKQENSNPWQS
jgi:hypothetical protein